ncbi:hypothetical protein H6F96_03595 [Microcoleus sp. FACHB-53]|nr:hypothetical protein [Microcoleus sp. FACHB-53]
MKLIALLDPRLSIFLSTHPKAGGLMKLKSPSFLLFFNCLSTHPKAGGLMKPRPLKPLSKQADKYIFVG